MRIVQIIDSLETGGAERMAVNYANGLSRESEFSGLVATRGEGSLKSAIAEKVCYLFLNKKRTIDIAAIKKLVGYCKSNKVNVLHAHSTSIMLAVMIKLWLPKIKIVWHDHYGNSEFLGVRPIVGLKFLIRFCSGAIAVNSKLEVFIKRQLNFSNTIYLANFATIDERQIVTTKLKGVAGKRIVCLANLRAQKNHLLLVSVATKLKVSFPDWTFHFIGKDFKDETAAKIRSAIIENKLEENVFIYGSCQDAVSILQQAEIAVLSSKSEGLPVAILEYGLLSKAVVTTAVGEIPMIIENSKNGYLVNSSDEKEFYESLKKLIEDPDRNRFGKNLHQKVKEDYGEKGILHSYLQWINTL